MTRLVMLDLWYLTVTFLFELIHLLIPMLVWPPPRTIMYLKILFTFSSIAEAHCMYV